MKSNNLHLDNENEDQICNKYTDLSNKSNKELKQICLSYKINIKGMIEKDDLMNAISNYERILDKVKKLCNICYGNKINAIFVHKDNRCSDICIDCALEFYRFNYVCPFCYRLITKVIKLGEKN